MTEQGTVIKIDDSVITLTCSRSEGCKSCNSSFCSSKSRTFQAENTPDLPVQTGDTVEVFLEPWKAVLAGFQVLILPLILFIAMYLIAENLLGFGGEGANVLMGLAGLVMGFGLSLLISKFKRKTDLPRLTRIITATR
ncbi:MAG: SoxR reducing system RseC family protein [Spirochaetales bacterium]|nr:SoxR reducing system RseC family protein [Spirochaetales bacterium]MCF7939268.1 SoxR reducing system RseC family protein [Spirochaetales bacterium]